MDLGVLLGGESAHRLNIFLEYGLGDIECFGQSTKEKVCQENSVVRSSGQALQARRAQSDNHPHWPAIPPRSLTFSIRFAQDGQRIGESGKLEPKHRFRPVEDDRKDGSSSGGPTLLHSGLSFVQIAVGYPYNYEDIKAQSNIHVSQADKLTSFDWQLDMEVASDKGKTNIPVV